MIMIMIMIIVFSECMLTVITTPLKHSRPTSVIISTTLQVNGTRSLADANRPALRVQRSVKVNKHSTIRYVGYGFLLVCCSNSVPKTLRYSISKNAVTLKSGQRSLKLIGTDADRSATYDFLLTFHSNHGPISHRFRDKLQFQSKIANFPPACILRPR